MLLRVYLEYIVKTIRKQPLTFDLPKQGNDSLLILRAITAVDRRSNKLGQLLFKFKMNLLGKTSKDFHTRVKVASSHIS